MAERMLIREIEIYSETYDVHGVIREYGVVTKLFFTYEGREVVMGLSPGFCLKDPEQRGIRLIESYISHLAIDPESRNPYLHKWFLEEYENGEKKFIVGHGVVSGHPKLPDGMFIHTSKVKAISVRQEDGELILVTRNSVYRCPLAYCSYPDQDRFPDLIPDYEAVKEAFGDKWERPSIEPGKVLLVLANYCEYYFHSVYYVPEGSEDSKPLKYESMAHVGMFQDSYLIFVPKAGIDLRYFPHFQNIEFYSERTNGLPLYLENVGDVTIYADTGSGMIRLDPGDRKEVTKANAEPKDQIPELSDGDLYPARIIED